MDKQVYLRGLASKCYMDGKEISYRKYLNLLTTDASEFINDETERILVAALDYNVFWGDVQDYLSPIVEQILIESVQEDQHTYINLVANIIVAYNKLKKQKIEKEVTHEAI